MFRNTDIYNVSFCFSVTEELSWRILTYWQAHRGTGCLRMIFGEHRWRNVARTAVIDRFAWPPFVWIILLVALNPGATIWWM